ncbi:hypothetical protein FEM48_Zijuj01G0271400 [Ziziphus jujuba var. spinosa]|uniref:Pentatricopeptide repeat-containing protein n=1 Tax=Ziziphus jujuba var. spinosa TaxID=714518 RepID=A0A978W568_ZIZJJ|nr:hypothetical protein FEM48_Zijuj01G0271400 [Ziziphus jujuba var. spinosa]
MKFMSTKFLSSSSKPNPHYRQPDAINHYLHISKSIGQLKQTHSLLLKTSTNSLHYDHLLARLLRRLVQFPDDNLCYARNLFDQIRDRRNEFLWTSLVRSHVLHGRFRQSISLYAKMHREGISPSGFTFSSVLNACARIPAILEGRQVNVTVVKSGYGKCGNVEEARMVFDEVPEHDASCWAAMVVCYAQNGYAKEAIETYEKMRKENIAVNEVAIVGALSACIQLGDVEMATKLAKHVDEGCCGEFF